MLSVDLDAVQAAGYDIVTPILVCNTDEYAAVEGLAGKDVVPGEDVVKIQLKKLAKLLKDFIAGTPV